MTPDEFTWAIVKALLIVVSSISLVFYIAWVAAKVLAGIFGIGDLRHWSRRHAKRVQVYRA
jgi:hypothetical protein